MTVELREIPPAPRNVRWPAVLWRRWPLLLAGSAFTLYGGLLSLLLWVAERSSYHATAERALDDRGTVAVGTVTRVRPGRTWRGEPSDTVSYRFAAADGSIESGESGGPPGLAVVGHEIELEHLADAPHTSRVLGGHVLVRIDLFGPSFWLSVAPGIALLGAWLLGALALRQVLRNGDAAIAEPFEVRRVSLMVPTMLDVRFRFRDHHARICEGRCWVRVRSCVGERLLTPSERPDSGVARVLWAPRRGLAAPAPTDWNVLREDRLPRMVVVHDRSRPSRHRLVSPSDFTAHPRNAPRSLPPRAPLG